MHGGKAESCAATFVLGAEEGLEDAGLNFKRDAGARVGYLDEDVVAGTRIGDVDAVVFINAGGARGDGDAAAVGHGIAGVDHEVEQHLIQAAGINESGGH